MRGKFYINVEEFQFELRRFKEEGRHVQIDVKVVAAKKN